MAKKKILWVVPRTFLPISDGASKANDALLRSFSSLNIDVEVTLLLFSESGNEDIHFYQEQYTVSSVFQVKKKILGSGMRRVFQVIGNIFSSSPLTASFFDLPENQKVLNKLESKKFDFVLYDGLHTYCGLKNIFKDSKFIYRSHNVEYDLWKESEFSGPSKWIIKNQKKKMRVLEEQLIKEAASVWTISEEDRDTYLKDFSTIQKDQKITYLPMSQEFKAIEEKKEKSEDFLFVGKLDWHPNTEGLIWLLSKVMPNVSDKVKLKIIGKGNFPIENFTHLKNVEFLGFVDSLDDHYEKSKASLIPIFSGSGTRIKVIEALAKGVSVLSTKFGIQGSGMNESHCFLADSAEEWIQLLNSWDEKTAFEKSQRASRELETIYGNGSLEKELNNLLV